VGIAQVKVHASPERGNAFMASRHAALFRRGFIPPPMPVPTISQPVPRRSLARLIAIVIPLRLRKAKRPRA
jgi:hypothetical protein